ncbi:MAG: M20 family metallopeptidase [Verrucomicrobiales bacterium]|nr:M20 family metallopeptidase [Verrucomicrobiales bacterium]
MSVIDTLADLVRLDSINPEWHGPGEAAVADYVRDFFERAGIECRQIEVLPGRPNVLVRLPGADPARRIVLEAHMDTVSVADMTIPPFEPTLRDGRLYGRGSCDVKAGLAAMMHAIRELHEAGETPPCEVILGAVIDEEHAFRGVLGLLDCLADGPLPEAAIVAEPTELRLIRANKGVLRYRIATRGRSAHSSKPHLGVNAIVGMAAVIEALVADDARLATLSHPLVGRATCSIGLIEGGAQVNFVPEHCRITIDRRLLPGETADGVLAACDRLLDAVRATHPDLTIVVEPPYLADEAMETSADAPVVTVASRVLAAMGLDPEPAGVPFGCDCTKLSRARIPSIIFGPGSIDLAHGAVEYVEIDQVLQARDFYRHFLASYG